MPLRSRGRNEPTTVDALVASLRLIDTGKPSRVVDLPRGGARVAAVRASGNEPPNVVNPDRLAQAAQEVAITAGQLKDYLYFVASDEMEGRDTPSRAS